MDPLITLKKIRTIIRNTTDRELVRLILDLQKEAFAIESHNLELAAELTSLKQQLDLARMHTRPPSDYYFLDGDDVPFCPKCWESFGDAIHLQAPVSAGDKSDGNVGFARKPTGSSQSMRGEARLITLENQKQEWVGPDWCLGNPLLSPTIPRIDVSCPTFIA